jgi:6,7-dimethyl-8-ribityllumazine synthase
LETLEGRPHGRGRRIGIVCSRWNGDVTSKLLDGALAALEEAGVAARDIAVAYVPGSFELPLAARRLAAARRVDAVVALGAVIRGETGHYDHVCRAAQEGLLRVGLEEDLPVLFGVLTCDTEEQALARAGGEHGNKGADVALDALRLADLFGRMRKRPAQRRRR